MADDNKTINRENVSIGRPVEGGCCYINFGDNPTLPTTAAEDITGSDSGWENLGEISENGYTKSVSTSSTNFKGWHGTVLISKISDEENTFQVEFTEIVRPTVLKLRYGESAVTLGDDGKVKAVDPTRVPDAEHPLIFDELLSNGTKMRTVFPAATIESIDDEPHQQGSLVVYGMTFTAACDDQGRPYYIRYAVAA